MNQQDSITYLKGVGPKRSETLKKLNIETLEDLIYFFPRRYEDRREAKRIIEAPLYEEVLLEVSVVTKKLNGKPYSKKQVLLVLCEDESASIELVFFNAKYLASYFEPGRKISLFGKITLNNGRRQMAHPEFHILGDKGDIRGLYPVYPLTEGLGQTQIRSMVTQARPFISEIEEWLPASLVSEYNLASPAYSIENIHFPISERSVKEGRYRLIFEELLVLQTGLSYIKRGRTNENCGIAISKDIKLDNFIARLPFDLTEGQIRSIREIEKDLESSKAMNRLVQGDVGSGKTIVSELAMYKTVKAGYQTAMMAPTELLAKQHLKNLKRDFEHFGISCELLSSSVTKKEREEILKRLKSGEIDILIGTHALIQPDVIFKSLALVVTDEQHRFGVNQRTLLQEKGESVNVLVMTATPIPRTLAVILYGDLDISVIDTLPKGRKPIKTYKRTYEARNKVYDFVREKVKEGRQAYVVCPLIEESEKMELSSAEEIYDELRKKYRDLRIGLVHGALKQTEKDQIMTEFKDGLIDILVSTVVIEVGIDVPNATVMVIENAERFGLAQLHQLRGRVGRSDIQSYCILLSDSNSETSQKRNDIMCQTENGFVIAEEDLKLRGPGEIFGTKQHGLPELHIADLVRNVEVLEKVRIVSNDILDEDPYLKSKKYAELRRRVQKLFGDNISLKM